MGRSSCVTSTKSKKRRGCCDEARVHLGSSALGATLTIVGFVGLGRPVAPIYLFSDEVRGASLLWASDTTTGVPGATPADTPARAATSRSWRPPTTRTAPDRCDSCLMRRSTRPRGIPRDPNWWNRSQYPRHHWMRRSHPGAERPHPPGRHDERSGQHYELNEAGILHGAHPAPSQNVSRRVSEREMYQDGANRATWSASICRIGSLLDGRQTFYYPDERFITRHSARTAARPRDLLLSSGEKSCPGIIGRTAPACGRSTGRALGRERSRYGGTAGAKAVRRFGILMGRWSAAGPSATGSQQAKRRPR